MPSLETIDFGRVRRLASSISPMTLRSLGIDPYTTYRLGQRATQSLLSRQEIREILREREWGGLTGSTTAAEEDGRTLGQKQVEALTRRLEESGHEVPDPQATGRQGVVGWLLNALGAPAGAITTPIHRAITGEGDLLRGVIEGFTGRDRRVGSDIMEALGVESRIGQGVLGFLLDVALDPLTYVGVGALRHVGTAATRTAAREALEREGLKVAENELDDIINKAIGPRSREAFTTEDPRVAVVARAFGRPVEQVAQGRGKKPAYRVSDVQPHLPRQYTLQVGIPFTSRQKDIADLTPLFRQLRQSVQELPLSSNPFLRQLGQMGARVGQSIRRTFSAYPVPANVANLFRQRQLKIDEAMRNVVMLGEKINRQLGGGYAQNPQIHEAIARGLDNPSIGTDLIKQLPEEQQKTALEVFEFVKKEFDDIAKREIDAGIMDPEHVRQFYFTHLLEGDPRAIQAARQEFAGREFSALRQTGRHQQPRKAPTLEEFAKFVDDFNAAHPELPDLRVKYDVGQVLATRRLASEVLLQNAKLIDNLINLGPEYVRKYTSRRPEPGFVHLTGVNEKLDKYVIRSDVADFLQDWLKVTTPDGFASFVRTYDSILNVLRTLYTATPGFHMRNFLGAVWNNWIMGVRNPKYYQDAIKMITQGRVRQMEWNREALQTIQVSLPDGRVLNGEEVANLASRFGLIRAGFMGDFGQEAIEDIGRRTTLRDIATLRFSRTFGEAVDDTARLAGFMHQLERHGDPWAAAIEVKRHLFDYSELSRVEKQYLRRAVLFYTWMRKNIPLQLEALLRKPGMYTGLEHAIEEGAHIADVDIEEMPSYLAQSTAIPLMRTEEGRVLMTTPYSLPAADITEAASALSGPQDFFRFLFNTLAPTLSIPAEIALNRRFFDQAPIDPIAEEEGGPPSRTALLNYLFQQSGLPYNIYRSITGQRELIPTRERGEDEFVYRSYAPFDIRNPLGILGIFGQYNPEYWQETVLPYRYAGELRGRIRRLTEAGETVYTIEELEQAEKLGLPPEIVRELRQRADELGMRKTVENLRKLYDQYQ